MKTTNILKIILFTISISGCTNEKSKITEAIDYNTYLNSSENKNIQLAKTEIDFWL